jgi:microcystin-dependent protein
MAYSYVTVTASNGQTNFGFSFPYLSKSHILAFVDAESVTFTWLNANTIVLDTPVSGTPEVTIRRATPKDDLLVDFNDGEILTEANQDISALQHLYIAQEIVDGSDDLAASDAANAAIQARDAALVAVGEAEAAQTAAEAAIDTIEGIIDDFEAGAFAPEVIGSDIASAATINPTGEFQFVTGSIDISDFSTSPSSCRLRFQQELNIIHGTKFMCQWGVDYRVIAGEILEFRKRSTGPDVYSVYSLNGPKERTGQSIEWNGTTQPAGFLEEDNDAISRTTYSGLFATIGTIHGAGNGSTTFNKPDSRGRTTINMDNGASVITSASTNGANANTMGGKGGAQTHTLTNSQLPSTNRTYDKAQLTAGATVAGGAGFDLTFTTQNTSSSGGGGAHSITQPWIAKKKYIRF